MRVELEGGGTLEVPLGEEWATDPATGANYLIQWTQDDTGTLQVRAHAAHASRCLRRSMLQAALHAPRDGAPPNVPPCPRPMRACPPGACRSFGRCLLSGRRAGRAAAAACRAARSPLPPTLRAAAAAGRAAVRARLSHRKAWR